MAVAEPSISLDVHQRPSTTNSPRLPRTLSPIPPISSRPMPSTFQRPFMDPPLQALPSIEAPPQPQAVTKTVGQPSCGAQTVSDYMPMDLLQTLKRWSNDALSPRAGSLGRQSLRHPSLPKSGTVGLAKVPPASVWNYGGRRAKLKHLTDAPPCICGAGKDISFLYDAELAKTGSKEIMKEGSVALPSTLIPEEYHVVKHPGVIGLEFHDDPYVTRSEEHDHHMTVFPSMRPAGRQEAVTLKTTLETMLKRAGVPNELKDSDLNGPTVMHNLLELLQKEQTIYNVCFHELIRQVSIHCVERGELLADIRTRYNNLLDRIPRQVKSLHDELVAQRTLDRKLSTELKRFKGKISALTDELSDVKEHDLHVTEQSRIAEEDLTSALADSEKNSSLLAEYHALYELQRNRLEDQVSNLTFERDIWQQASYDLARRVADECNRQTVQRLQLCEKSWCKLAGHFSVVLSDKDTQQLLEIQKLIQRWREEVVIVTQGMLNMERKMKERLEKVIKGMEKWSEAFSKILDPDAGSPGLNVQQMERLFSDIKVWQEVVNREADNFSGDSLLGRQEELSSLGSLMEQWTEVAVTLFTRHQEEGQPQSEENRAMLELNATIEWGLKVYGERISGENGVATGFIHIMTPLETWDTKLGLCLSSHDKQLPTSEWIRFTALLKEWISQLQYILNCIGTNNQATMTRDHYSGDSKEGDADSKGETDEGDKKGDEEEVSEAPLIEMINEVEKWRAVITHTTDTSDTHVTAQVHRLHSKLVKWMVELLLNLTSTKVEQDQDLTHRQHVVTTADLKMDYTGLVDSISSFTKMLIRRCVDVVRDIVDQRVQEDYPNPDEEQVELKRLGDEMEEWVKLASLLLQEVESGVEQVVEEAAETEEKERKESPVSQAESDKEGGNKDGEADKEVPEDLPESMSVVGVDDNIHTKSLQRVIDETEPPPLSTSADLGLSTEDVMPEGRQPLRKDMEALIVNLDEANKKLEEQEEKTRQIEERAQTAESDLEDARRKIAELESELHQAKTSLEQHSHRGSGKGTRGPGAKANTVKKGPGTRPISRKS